MPVKQPRTNTSRTTSWTGSSKSLISNISNICSSVKYILSVSSLLVSNSSSTIFAAGILFCFTAYLIICNRSIILFACVFIASSSSTIKKSLNLSISACENSFSVKVSLACLWNLSSNRCVVLYELIDDGFSFCRFGESLTPDSQSFTNWSIKPMRESLGAANIDLAGSNFFLSGLSTRACSFVWKSTKDILGLPFLYRSNKFKISISSSFKRWISSVVVVLPT